MSSFVDPSTFEKNEHLKRFSMMPNMPGISTGKPTIDMLISMLMSGKGMAPVQSPGQSMYDAMQQRNRSNDILLQMQHGVQQSLISQKLGGFSAGASRLGAMVSGGPDGLADTSIMRALNAGNPLKAMMGLQSNMTGLTSAALTGHVGNMSATDVSKMGTSFMDANFNHRTVNRKDVEETWTHASKGILNDSGRASELAQYRRKSSTGGADYLDFDSLKKDAEKLGDSMSAGMKEAVKKTKDMISTSDIGKTKLYQDRNAKVMRGFESQEINSMYAMSADLGMISRDHMTNAKGEKDFGAEGFSKHGLGAIKAAQDLFGGDAKEAFTSLNNLLGNSGVSLNSEEGAKKVTKLARDVASAARNAGISIQAMMGIINETKALASMHGEMKYLGGAGATKIAIGASQSGLALMSTMTPEYIRKQGGTVEAMRQHSSSQMDAESEPISNRLRVYQSIVEQSSMPKEKKDELYGKLKEYASQTDAGAFNSSNEQNLVSMISQATGKQAGAIMNLAEDPNMRIMGQQLDQKLSDDSGGKHGGLGIAGTNAALSQVLDVARMTPEGYLGDVDGKKLSGEERLKAFTQALANVGEKGGEKDDETVYAKYYGGNQELAGMVGGDSEEAKSVRARVRYAAKQKMNPNFNKELETIKTAQAKGSEADEKMANQYAGLQGSFLTNFTQYALSGGLKNEGFQGIMKMLSIPESEQKITGIMDSLQSMNEQKTNGTYLDAYKAINGEGGLDEESLKQLQEVSGTNGITINQLLGSVKGGEEGYSKSALAGKGISYEKATKAAGTYNKAFKDGSGKFGDKTFMSSQRDMLTSMGVDKSANIAADDVMKQYADRTQSAVGEYLNTSQEGGKWSDFLKKGGYMGDDGKVDVQKVTDEFDQDKNKELKESVFGSLFKELQSHQKEVKDKLADSKSSTSKDGVSELLLDLQKMMGNSSSEIVDALRELTNAFTGLSTKT
jgi:hypothetical protein